MDQVLDTAPAQSDTPAQPVTAVDQAVEKHDVSSFRDAKRAERTGTPLPVAKPESPPEPLPAPDPDPPDPKPAATAQPAVPGVSKRQQQINDYERRIAEQDQRIRALESSQPPAAPRSEPPAPTEPEYKRFRAMPDAPKLDQFESIEDHAAAMALFIADKRFEERDARAKQETIETNFVKEQEDRNRTFQARVGEVQKTNPEFWEQISPDVKALRPRAALAPQERPSAANDLADQILDHEYGPTLMVHLTEHPDVLHRLTHVPSRSQLYVELGKLYATFDQPAPASSPKQLSSAPEPVFVVGKKAAEPVNEEEAAVAANDVSGFRAKRLQARVAALKR